MNPKSDPTHAELAAIVARLRAERDGLWESLEDSEGLYTWTWLPDANIWRPSDRLQAFHGVAPDRAVATLETYRARLLPEDRLPVVAALRAAARDGGAFAYEERGVHADGQVWHLQTRGRAVGGDGEPVRLVALSVDMTARRHLEHQVTERNADLEAANEELQAQVESLAAQREELQLQAVALEVERSVLARVVDRVPAALAYVDAALRTRWHNREMARMLDWPAGGRADAPFLDAVWGPARPALGRALRRTLAEGAPTRLTSLPGACGAGAVRWTVDLVPIPGTPRDPGGVLIFAAEEAHGAAPAGPGLAELLDVDEQAHAGAWREVLAPPPDLLQAARTWAGALTLEQEDVDLGEVLEAVAQQARAAARTQGVRLEVEVGAGLGGRFDRRRIARLLRDVVAFALGTAGAGGELACVVRRSADAIEAELRIVRAAPETVSPHAAPGAAPRPEPVAESMLALRAAIARGLADAHGGDLYFDPPEGPYETIRLLLPVR